MELQSKNLKIPNLLLYPLKKSSNQAVFVAIFFSWFICAFGQPAHSWMLSFLASTCGYGLFWYAIEHVNPRAKRVFFAGIWYFLVSAIQLSWMISFEYQGGYIVALYLILSAGVGMQFAFLERCSWLQNQQKIIGVFALAATWTLLEWMRVFLLCGFTWNPIGLSFAYSHYPLFLASIFGIYGLSFWAVLTNGFACLWMRKKTVRGLFLWGFFVLIPILAGLFHEKIVHAQARSGKSLSAALIQTSLFPEEKDPFLDRRAFIYPIEQWMNILDFLQKAPDSLDLIALPEVALPFGPYRTVFNQMSIQDLWECYFGKESLRHLPQMPGLYGKKRSDGLWYVSNGYIAQALANQYQAEVIVGLDHQDPISGRFFNGAFHFTPKGALPAQYRKCILVPGSEYLPFSWCRDIAQSYGLTGSYEHGKNPGVFRGKMPLGISICYEETYSNFMRKSRQMGAEIFINLSNDAWFPDTNLASQHFDHGRIRGVENGVSVLRSTNTGVTAAVDAFGKVQKTLAFSTKDSRVAKALFVNIPTYSYQTLYTYFGDALIITLGVICLGACSFFRFRNPC